jgi:hypothetical protein
MSPWFFLELNGMVSSAFPGAFVVDITMKYYCFIFILFWALAVKEVENF